MNQRRGESQVELDSVAKYLYRLSAVAKLVPVTKENHGGVHVTVCPVAK